VSPNNSKIKHYLTKIYLCQDRRYQIENRIPLSIMSFAVINATWYVTSDYRREVNRNGVQTRSMYFRSHWVSPFPPNVIIQPPEFRQRESRIVGFYYESSEEEDGNPRDNYFTRQLRNEPRRKRRRSGIWQ